LFIVTAVTYCRYEIIRYYDREVGATISHSVKQDGSYIFQRIPGLCKQFDYQEHAEGKENGVVKEQQLGTHSGSR